MCTAELPFVGFAAMQVMTKVVREQPRPIRELAPETPPWLCELIAKLHAKAPADRYPSAQEVVNEFDRRLERFERTGEWGESDTLRATTAVPVTPVRRKWWWPFS